MNISTMQMLRTRLKLPAVIIICLLVSLVTLVPRVAGAQGQTLGLCAATIPLNLSPGLSLRTTQGTNQSFGETGTLRCSGTIGGQTITGPGTIGFSGVYAGTCLATTGSGTFSFSLPTSGGTIHRSGSYSSPSLLLTITFNGTFSDGRLSGVGAVVPVQGDCNLKPMTKSTFVFTGLQLDQ